MDYIDRIDQMGGIVASIEAGFPQKEIADAAYRYQRQVDDGAKVVVGVNRYAMAPSGRPATLKIDADVEREQLSRLARVKTSRDDARLKTDLVALRQAAGEGENLIPFMLQAVRDYATVGEVCAALIPVFGTYREVAVL